MGAHLKEGVIFIVARGASDATRASERVSPASVKARVFFTVARGPVPRDDSRTVFLS